MFRKIYFIFLLTVIFAHAETLEEVMKRALKDSPYLKKYIYQMQAIEGDIIDSSQYYNPEASVEFGRLYSQTDSAITLTAFSVSQRLRLWGEMDHAINSLQYKKDAIKYLMDQEKNLLLGQIYQKFYDALYLKKQIEIKQRELKIVKNVYRFVKRSYQLGETVPLDLLRAKRDLELVKIELRNLKAQYEGSLNELSALVGSKVKDVKGNIYKFEPLEEIDLEKLPVVKYYVLLLKSMDEEINRQKALAKPQVSVGFVAGEDPTETGKYEFGVALSSTLPIFNKNQGKILKTASQKRVLIQEKNTQLLRYEYRLKAIKEQYGILQKQIRKIDKSVIPKMKEALALARKGYRYGVTSFLELSSVRKQYFETILYKAELSYRIHQLYGEYIKIGGYKNEETNTDIDNSNSDQ